MVRRLNALAARWKPILGAAVALIAVLGIFTFPLFILEEATQVAIWGTWQADKTELHILKAGINVVESLNTTAKSINYIGGWLHPLSFLSYRGYAKSIDFWIMASKSKILANDPRLMDGETLTFLFRPQITHVESDGVRLSAGRVIVIMDQAPQTSPISVTGKALWNGQQIVFDLRQNSR